MDILAILLVILITCVVIKAISVGEAVIALMLAFVALVVLGGIGT